MRKQNPLRHQQQGVSLRTFAEQTGIREGQLLHYIRKGQIQGAVKHPITKKWRIYPPAKLVLSGLPYQGQPAAFDFGTSPHGLSAGLRPSIQKTREAPDIPLSGRPPLTLNSSME